MVENPKRKNHQKRRRNNCKHGIETATTTCIICIHTGHNYMNSECKTIVMGVECDAMYVRFGQFS